MYVYVWYVPTLECKLGTLIYVWVVDFFSSYVAYDFVSPTLYTYACVCMCMHVYMYVCVYLYM